MEYDVYNLKYLTDYSTPQECILKVYDESPCNPQFIKLELITNTQTYTHEGEYYFEILQTLRKELGALNIQLLCNGSVKNVYPSAMMVDMGCSKAYVLTLGKHASLKEQVDIFENELANEYATVDEQDEYYETWINTKKNNQY